MCERGCVRRSYQRGLPVREVLRVRWIVDVPAPDAVVERTASGESVLVPAAGNGQVIAFGAGGDRELGLAGRGDRDQVGRFTV